jgi:hypothetical protein
VVEERKIVGEAKVEELKYRQQGMQTSEGQMRCGLKLLLASEVVMTLVENPCNGDDFLAFVSSLA